MVSSTAAAGNGHDQVAAPAGSRCRFCDRAINDAAAEQIGEQWFHTGVCITEARKWAASASPEQPKKRTRIKGADTTPVIEELPE